MHVWNKDTKIGRKTKELKFYSFVSLPDILPFHTLPQICNLRYDDTQAEKESSRLQICRNTRKSEREPLYVTADL